MLVKRLFLNKYGTELIQKLLKVKCEDFDGRTSNKN